MRRVAKIKFQKKPRKKKAAKLDFSEYCDHCGAPLPVCRERGRDSMEIANRHGCFATPNKKGVPMFFCKSDCMREFIVGEM